MPFDPLWSRRHCLRHLRRSRFAAESGTLGRLETGCDASGPRATRGWGDVSRAGQPAKAGVWGVHDSGRSACRGRRHCDGKRRVNGAAGSDRSPWLGPPARSAVSGLPTIQCLRKESRGGNRSPIARAGSRHHHCGPEIRSASFHRPGGRCEAVSDKTVGARPRPVLFAKMAGQPGSRRGGERLPAGSCRSRAMMAGRRKGTTLPGVQDTVGPTLCNRWTCAAPAGRSAG